jgi:hypothetical protein
MPVIIQMKAAAALAALALLAACQSPIAPKAGAGEDSRTTHVLREEPHRAAVCIARNVDKHATEYSASIRQGIAPALVHVEVRGEQPVSLVRLLVEGSGSIAEIWIAPDSLDRGNALTAIMVDGC